MRRSASFVLTVAAVTVLVAACVPGSEVPPIKSPISAEPFPTATSTAMLANPSAMTISKSAYPSGGTSYPGVTVSQPSASVAPVVVTAQSTCITNGNMSIFSATPNGNATTVEVEPLVIGQCVIQFGGQDGVTLLVPVTITN
ncbi:MAG TPA: hypothetical protein VGG22_06890 [Candidatus Baltobacteraceae bacterium]|jgi:hypothetical protein